MLDFCTKVLDRFEKKEFVIVNDCSKDNTLQVLEKLSKEISYLKILNNEINSGHGKSLRRAYENAQGELIFHCDSDNQFIAGDFWKLYDVLKQKKLEIAIGYRKERYDALHRLAITRVLRLMGFLFFGVKVRDSNSPFKLYTRAALDKLLKIVPSDIFAPSLTMNIAAKKIGIAMEEIPVNHLPRKTGKVSIIRWKLIKVCCQCVKELLQFRRILTNYEKG